MAFHYVDELILAQESAVGASTTQVSKSLFTAVTACRMRLLDVTWAECGFAEYALTNWAILVVRSGELVPVLHGVGDHIPYVAAPHMEVASGIMPHEDNSSNHHREAWYLNVDLRPDDQIYLCYRSSYDIAGVGDSEWLVKMTLSAP